MPPLHLLIKPSSGLCNLRCEYCFYHDISEKREQSSYGFMSIDTLRQVLQKVFAYADTACSITFQGGEPTLIGLPFFRQVVALEKEYNQKQLPVSYSIQTNGTTLDAEWAKFFAEQHFLVGISVDGTIHTHDAFRKDAKGQGSFLSVMRGLDLLRNYQVDFNILTVVNRRTAASIRKIYAYYKKMDFRHQQYIPCLDPLDAPAGSFPFSLSPKQYGDFLVELFHLWYADFLQGNLVFIRQFENYISLLLLGYAESCDMNGFCGIQHVVEADGEVYPCDFYVLDKYKLGNLNQVGFADIAKKREEIGFCERSHKLPSDCMACPYLSLCRGGCYRHRNMSLTAEHSNYFCESFRIFFAACLPELKQAAEFIRRQKRL